MTFDDGIVGVYQLENKSKSGDKPDYTAKLKEKFYFSYETLGVNRYYTALQAGQRIETVISVPGWANVNTNDICIFENGCQYQIRMLQPTIDDDSLKITRISLERLGDVYAIA